MNTKQHNSTPVTRTFRAALLGWYCLPSHTYRPTDLVVGRLGMRIDRLVGLGHIGSESAKFEGSAFVQA